MHVKLLKEPTRRTAMTHRAWMQQHYLRAQFLPVDLQLFDAGRSLKHWERVVTMVQNWRHHIRRRR
jgi:hypothetical protein